MRGRSAHARCSIPTLTTLGAIRLHTVGVDPEAKRHVAVEQQVGNGTTRHVAVVVSTAVVEHNKCCALEQRYIHTLASVRCA